VRTLIVGVMTALAMVVIVALRTPAIGSGNADSYRFMATQPGDPYTPVTYSSCLPVRVQVNTEGVQDERWAKDLVLSAMGQVSAATHLSLVYVGDSDAAVHWPAPPLTVVGGERPVLVGFATPTDVPGLRGNAGLGGSSGIIDDGREMWVTGQVALNSEVFDRMRHQVRGTALARAVVMHELAHVVGLNHVHDRHELMHDDNLGKTSFGPGDLHGLALLGRGPCVR
jgi:hypothetical protein